jgi:dCMP deaminase
MRIAHEVATRATCDRKHVGCVLVRDHTIISTGYNGSVAGTAHCDDEGHLVRDDHCVRTIHAEMNALVQAAKNGAVTDQCTAYITSFPCWLCCKMMLNAGIREIFYDDEYRPDPLVHSTCEYLSIPLTREHVDFTA